MSFDIKGTGGSLPDLVVTNDDLAKIVDTDDEWITSRTGIKKRHILCKETLLDISVRAANEALTDAGIKPKQLDYIICSTLQGDDITPAHACLIQQKVGAECPAFDINSACTGFINALLIADALITSGQAETILVVGADKLSKFIDWTDRSTCVLFGDGAGAVVVGKSSTLSFVKVFTEGSKEFLSIPGLCPPNPFCDLPAAPPFFNMNGQEVFKFAVSSVVKSIKATVKQLGLAISDIAHFVLHQANGRIIDMVRSMLKLPAERFPVNYAECGNTSSASIPLMLNDLNRQGRLKKGDKLLLSAFGAGLTYGTCVIEWSK